MTWLKKWCTMQCLSHWLGQGMTGTKSLGPTLRGVSAQHTVTAAANKTVAVCQFAGLSNQQYWSQRFGVTVRSSLESCSCRFITAETVPTFVCIDTNVTSIYCFRICIDIINYVLFARTAWKCFLLLHCVPFHSSFTKSWFHLCHLCVSLIQLYKKRRIQGRWKKPQWLKWSNGITAKIAH